MLFFPVIYIAAASALVLVVQIFAAIVSYAVKSECEDNHLPGQTAAKEQTHSEQEMRLNAKTISEGDKNTAVFDFARFLSCIILVGLFAFSGSNPSSNVLQQDASTSNSILCGLYLYASMLAFVPLVANRKWREIAIGHLTPILFISFMVIVCREVWPLATHTLSSIEGIEGGLLLLKLIFITISSAITPLSVIESRPCRGMSVKEGVDSGRNHNQV
ncbi:hypothetical protein C8Q75DRAFT_788173 [Abortiporus biennis]|nr:hypothetical protein C8Q75DRAFT_788173 [Abortiporus biennis]